MNTQNAAMVSAAAVKAPSPMMMPRAINTKHQPFTASVCAPILAALRQLLQSLLPQKMVWLPLQASSQL